MAKKGKKEPKKLKKGATIALIVAGGSGSRMAEGRTPKQYRKLAGVEVLRRSILAFSDYLVVDAIRVVVRPEDEKLYKKATQGLTLLSPVKGGSTRQQSVYNGLKSLKDYKPEKVLIHDAARPLVDGETIRRVVTALDTEKAVVPAVGVADTIKEIKSGKVEKTLERSRLVAVQTPQGFRYEEILKAHSKAKKDDYPDDAALMEAAGYTVAVVEGSAGNFKITTEADMKKAQQALGGEFETRVGQGFDVHAFEKPGSAKEIMLCGVEVAYNRKLKGHSDADVGLHALTDAILGAMAKEDIGFHFSPKDKRWKNADSTIFLRHAIKLLEEEGGRLIHADITFLCEEPKIGPYRTVMRKKLAHLMKVDISRVSVKATTTEKLGFLGRKEGLAAEAIATIEWPRVTGDE